ncbi:MAG: 3'-5' exonuclease, partial [Gammaproteobacteria bacterium]|nr:3'-5' exonuclease [Gammaproteobacteria bacterium]
LGLYGQCDLRVAHNTTFDNRIIRIALKRYMRDLIADDEWKDRELYFCTHINSKKIMGGKSGQTLEEAYKHFTGNVLEGAHNAMVDTLACMEIYWAMQDLDTTEPEPAA